MRVTRYAKAFEGDNWMVVNMRCSAHVAYSRLNNLMLQNGWVRWSMLREKMNDLKKKIAKTNPTKYPNWKEVKIPMLAADVKQLPLEIQEENRNKNITIEAANDGN